MAWVLPPSKTLRLSHDERTPPFVPGTSTMSLTLSVKTPLASPAFSIVAVPSTTWPGTIPLADMMASFPALLTWLMLPAVTVFFGLGADDVNAPRVQVTPTTQRATRRMAPRIHVGAVRPRHPTRSRGWAELSTVAAGAPCPQ